MHIKTLKLMRYGHFEDRELSFAPSGITIIYGPNEAGKSTSLSAIADLLYGFGHQCPYDFRHQSSQLRIAADVVSRAGEKLSFLRRKGNKETLLAAEDHPLPDSSLTPFLGSSNKEFFQKSFGLSHLRLRQGGDAIGRADGDLGQILFEAGSGITSLAEVQSLLDVEAQSIFAPRKSQNRLLYQTIDEYAAANAALKEAILKQADWSKAQRDHKTATANMQAVRTELMQITNQQKSLNRWREILVQLSELDRLREELSALGEETALPENARDKFADAVAQRRHGIDLISQMKTRLEAVQAEAAECIVDTDLLDLQDEIQHLYELAVLVETTVSAMPALQTEVTFLKRQIADMADRFDLPMTGGVPQLPKPVDCNSFSELITRKQTLDRDLEKAGKSDLKARGEADQLKAELEDLGTIDDPRTDSTLLQKLMASAAGLADYSKLNRSLRKYEKQVEESLLALPWWTKDAKALFKAKLPAIAQVDQFKKSIDASARKLELAKDKLEAATDELAAAEHRLSDYRERESIITDADLEDARAQRQAAWTYVRRVLEGKPKPTSKDLAKLGAGDSIIPAYETLADKADSVADERFDTVEKIADHNSLQRDVSEKRHLVESLDEKFNKLSADHDALLAEWKLLWKASGVQPGAPEVMREGLGVVSTLKETAAARDEATEELAAVENANRDLHAQLLEMAQRLDVPVKAGSDINTLTAHLQTALESKAQQYSSIKTLRARMADRERSLLQTRQDLDALAAAQAEWTTQWKELCGKTQTASDLAPAQAEDVVKAWSELRVLMADLDRKQSEQERGQITVDQFAQAAAKHLRASVETPGEAIAAVRAAHKQVQAMQRLATRREGIEKQRAELASSIEDHQAAVLKAGGEIKSLLELARIADEDALPAAITSAEYSRRLRIDIASAQQRLVQSSEGDGEESLRSGAQDLTRETIKEELDTLAIAAEDVTRRMEDAARHEEQARRAVADLEQKSGAHQHAQAMQNAVAKMQVQARDYLRAQAASILLRQGIERIRDKHKNPILAKASGFFAELTTGSFAGLATDYDSKDNPTIVGIRHDNQRIFVDGMSDGTRDQLYLALRLAFVENYCATEEPLPFIGDDLFVHFDDSRTAAGLKLLAGLSDCQVILFTHHDHIAALAKDVLGGDVKVLELPSALTA